MPLGATLSTKAEDGYLALMEATAFGTRKIIETFNGGGVLVAEFVVAGGLIKSSFLMQLYCDVINLPLSLLESDQCPALGFAIHAAAASGYYSNVREAADRMGRVSKAKYRPESKRAAQYDRLYAEYQIFHDYFGRDTNDVMRRLKVLKREVAWASH